MPVTYQVERWADVWPEMEPHWKAHHAEVALDHATVTLDIDLEAYHALAAQNILHVVTVRADGLLVGYHLSLIKPHIRYKSTLHAFADVFYVAPAYRRGVTGYRLFQYVEQTWKARGVRKAITGSKVHLDMTRLFQRQGWRVTETVLTKVLKE